MNEKPLCEMTDAELRAVLHRRKAEHIANVTCLERVRECCNRSGEALRDVRAEIERRQGNE